MERIIIKDSPGFNIEIGSKHHDFINRLKEKDKDKRPTDEEIDILQKEAVDILSNCINPIDTIGNVTGLAFGYVQSGKTMSFTTLTTLAADNGFKLIIFFAGTKNNLLSQTTNRLKKDLSIEGNSKNYRVFQNPLLEENAHKEIRNTLRKRIPPTILITVLKHKLYISELIKIFNYPDLKNEFSRSGVLIIDDEADQASLNTFGRKNSKKEDWEDDEFSPTYNCIIELKSSLPNHSYVQYTATPQGPLLINMNDLLSPKFHVVLTPGKQYTGGKSFFIDNQDLIVKIPENEVYHPDRNPLPTPPKSLKDALKTFLIAVSIQVNILEKVTFLSMLIHADRTNDASKKFNNWVSKIISAWGDTLEQEDNDPGKIELLDSFKESYKNSVIGINPKPTFNEVMFELQDVIYDTRTHLYIQESKKIDWASSSNIIIGAEKLNRGFTVEELAVTYMPRHTVGKSNADTMQQRCRFFGYKAKYLNSCRVYLPKNSIREYKEYINHEETTRRKLKETKDIGKFIQSLILDSGQNPTRLNILSKDTFKYKMNGWRQINALNHIKENKEFIENFINSNSFKVYKDFGSEATNHKYIKLTIRDTIDFLRKFQVSGVPDIFRISSTIQYLEYIKNKNNIKYSYLYQMGYEAKKGGRERSLNKKNLITKINNIFQGRSNDGGKTYPGDRSIMKEDFFCIQIHKIKLTDTESRWSQKKLFTLGLYYPEKIAHDGVAVFN